MATFTLDRVIIGCPPLHIITKAKEISREQALLPESEMDAATGPFCDRVMDLAFTTLPGRATTEIRRYPLEESRPYGKTILQGTRPPL